MRADTAELGTEVSASPIDDVTRGTTRPLINRPAFLETTCNGSSCRSAQRANVKNHRLQFGVCKSPDAWHTAIGNSISNDSRQRLVVLCPGQHRLVEIGAFPSATRRSVTPRAHAQEELPALFQVATALSRERKHSEKRYYQGRCESVHGNIHPLPEPGGSNMLKIYITIHNESVCQQI
jgi:hypothetical protein